MENFKVVIESENTHAYLIPAPNPETASKQALTEFQNLNPSANVSEVLVLDPEDEMGFEMPILQYNQESLKELLKVTNGI